MMKQRPIIGLTPQYDIENDRIRMQYSYTEAVLAAGGVPVVLDRVTDPAALETLCGRLDGVLFTGGPDIHPHRYGAEVLPECGTISEVRDALEFAVYRAAMERDLPVFGICRGAQFLNVAAGGTLHQNIQEHPAGVMHRVTVTRDSALFGMTGAESFTVNSFHHQAVCTPAPGCVVTAVSADGWSEAIEMPGRQRFWLGVQWHPECLYRDDRNAMVLFERFVSACAAYCEEMRG